VVTPVRELPRATGEPPHSRTAHGYTLTLARCS